jgi:hypothetical protein
VERQEIDVRAETTASPATVHALLRDGRTWPVWSPIDRFELESPGDGDPEGLGAIRLFHTGRKTSREEVVDIVPGRRFSYALLGGLPLVGYRADVDLTPVPSGTEIRWHSTFRPKVPGTGWIYRLALGKFIERTVRGLAQHAASLAPATADGA